MIMHIHMTNSVTSRLKLYTMLICVYVYAREVYQQSVRKHTHSQYQLSRGVARALACSDQNFGIHLEGTRACQSRGKACVSIAEVGT